MQGYNALFPMAFHYTGTPILVMAESIATGDKFLQWLFRNVYDVPEEVMKKMSNPEFLAKYFHMVSKRALERYGLAIDWRREFTSIDPEFQKFIEWQFLKLRELGYIEQGTHPVGWCPAHSMPVGMHDTKDDKEPELEEFTVILFRNEKGIAFPTATLRPETVFGVTNIWINPQEKYVIADVNGDSWVLALRAVNRLKYQLRIEIKEEIEGSKLMNTKVRNPITGEWIPILPGEFVDPSTATGVVMSVPAHAPFDYIALIDLKNNKKYPESSKIAQELEPRSIITVPGYSSIPARDAVIKRGIKSQNEKELLEDATKEIYSAEFSTGTMKNEIIEIVMKYNNNLEVIEFIKKYIAGKSVKEAREKTKELLKKLNAYAIIYEIINKPVYCRCGAEVVVKLLEDQWFINYGNLKWKKKAREALSNMRIVPEEVRSQFEATIDWLQRKACARTRGLGTPLPWEKSWIIESLSDSTIYMAFYTVIHKIREFQIPPEKLIPEFWEFVMLGRGDVKELANKLGIDEWKLEAIRREFDYWYPLDWRVSGKDLIPNHLTFFIFNHVAIFPRDKWPKGIIAHGWVLVEGEKMSKSKGNTIPLMKTIDMYGVDAVRLALVTIAEVNQDLNFTSTATYAAAEYLAKLANFIENLYTFDTRDKCELIPDKWLCSVVSKRIEKVTKLLESVRIREAAIEVFYNIKSDIEKYLSMVNKPCNIIKDIIENWIKLMAPFTPHIAEELWHMIGKSTFVINEKWPEAISRDFDSELAIKYVDVVISDIREITKVLKKTPNKVVLYVTPSFAYSILRDLVTEGIKKDSMRKIIENLATKGLSKKVAATQARRIIGLSQQLSDELKELIRHVEHFDEYSILKTFSDYIAKSVKASNIEIMNSYDKEAPDLGRKKEVALPLKPGIYIE